MNQSHSRDGTAPSDGRIDFAGRPPSTSWERVPIADSPENHIWVWFKPAHAPQGLIVRVPDETFRNYPRREQLTMRKLLQAAGVEPRCVSMWYLYGVPSEGQNGTALFLDQAIPQPATEAESDIVICITAQNVEVTQPATAPAAAAEEEDRSQVFARIDADWKAILQMEKQATGLRKQLSGMLNRLDSLNRDLSPEEGSHATRQDKKDWRDARRWLRDAATQLSRYIKEHDVGETSAAGRRKWFEQTYRQFVVPRRQFDGMLQAQREYENYRKMVQVFLKNMNTAYSNAARDGERRARQVLNKIAARVRAARSKR